MFEWTWEVLGTCQSEVSDDIVTHYSRPVNEDIHP